MKHHDECIRDRRAVRQSSAATVRSSPQARRLSRARSVRRSSSEALAAGTDHRRWHRTRRGHQATTVTPGSGTWPRCWVTGRLAGELRCSARKRDPAHCWERCASEFQTPRAGGSSPGGHHDLLGGRRRGRNGIALHSGTLSMNRIRPRGRHRHDRRTFDSRHHAEGAITVAAQPKMYCPARPIGSRPRHGRTPLTSRHADGAPQPRIPEGPSRLPAGSDRPPLRQKMCCTIWGQSR